MKTIRAHFSVPLVWSRANLEACQAGSRLIEPVHFFLAVLAVLDHVHPLGIDGEEITPSRMDALAPMIEQGKGRLGLPDEDLTRLRRSLRRRTVGETPGTVTGLLHRSADSREIMAGAARRAFDRDASEMDFLDLLEELLKALPPEARAIWPGGEESDLPSVGRPAAYISDRPVGARSGPDEDRPFLEAQGRDLTALARRGRLAPVVGRETEIALLMRYLQRTVKRNVIVVGQAGVGKTALIEGLAQKLAAAGAPAPFRTMRIVQISAADLTADTKYRGELERRVRDLVRDVQSDPGVVLFIDEIHLVVHAEGGGGSSGPDIANLLKPALSRGDFRCIGATTDEDFDRSIKGDRAFLRRFQILRLDEPGTAESLRICRAWAARIGEIQGVAFSDEAIESAVTLSQRHLTGRALPDKAIDLLENAAAFVKVDRAFKDPGGEGKAPDQVTPQHIIQVLEEEIGASILGGSFGNLEKWRDRLRAELVGQEAATGRIIEALKRRDGDIGKDARPLAVLLFAGASGVGKTLAAESLAKMFQEEKRAGLFRFQMGDYAEPHDLSRLVGAPPGFIGHDRPGALFRCLDSHVRGAFLLDDVDKAHPDVLDYFQRIFETGEARDSRGILRDFRNYLFLLTSGGTFPTSGRRPIGFVGKASARGRRHNGSPGLDRLGRLSRDFAARVDAIIEFASPGASEFACLFDREADRLSHEVWDVRECRLAFSPAAKKVLIRSAEALADGYRGFLKAFQDLVAVPVRLRVAGRAPGARLKIDGCDEALVLI